MSENCHCCDGRDNVHDCSFIASGVGKVGEYIPTCEWCCGMCGEDTPEAMYEREHVNRECIVLSELG